MLLAGTVHREIRVQLKGIGVKIGPAHSRLEDVVAYTPTAKKYSWHAFKKKYIVY